jgi:hypothetical protein
MKRILSGQIYTIDDGSEELLQSAKELVEAAEQIYPSLASMQPAEDVAPQVRDALEEVRARQLAIERGEIEQSDVVNDVSFVDSDFEYEEDS